MTNIRIAKTINLAKAAALVAVLLIACAAFAPRAYAENVQLDAPVQLSDDITKVEVSKLDADTHDYVVGATMEIVNERTGEVVDSWVTTDTTHQNLKGLEVEEVYILREIEAPEGYDKVEDVRFKVNETEGTGITVLSQGSDSELVESYRFSLYDKKKPLEHETVVTKTTKTPAPKTGDETPITFVAALVGVGLLAIVVLQLAKRSIGRKEE